MPPSRITAPVEPGFSRLEQRRGSSGFAASYVGGPMFGTSTYSAHLVENLSTVSAAINAIAGMLACMPAWVYRMGDAGRTVLPNHPVARLLRQPNARSTWPDFCEFLLAQTLLHGNGIAIIDFDGAGRPVQLTPVPTMNVQYYMMDDSSLAYNIAPYLAPWGQSLVPKRYLAHEVLHLKDRSDDGGWLGRSRISRAPQVLANAMSGQAFANGIWENSAAPSGIITHPGHLSPEAKNHISEDFLRHYSGPQNAGKTPVFEEGMTFQAMSVSPADAQVLESRRFSVEEVCRLFNVPPPIVQSYEHNTFTNASQASIWYAQNTLLPWARKLEAEFARQVFGSDDCALEIDLSGLLRGDAGQRWANYAIALSNDVLTVDEVREIEGFNPRGDAGKTLEPVAE